MDIPKKFVCSITSLIMADPVFTSDGQTYEREGIEGWLHSHNTSPKTGMTLQDKRLTPNWDKKSDIEEYLAANPELYGTDEIYLPKSWVDKLTMAIRSNQIDIVREYTRKDKRLLTIELSQQYTAFHLACEYGSLELTKYILDSLQERNCLDSIKTFPSKFKPLHLNSLLEEALIARNQSLFDIMIHLGADYIQNDPDKNTLLHRLAIAGDFEATSWLVQQNCDIECVNVDGNTPLLLGVIHKQYEIVQLYLSQHANKSHRNYNNHNVVTLALDAVIPFLTKNDIQKSSNSTSSISSLVVTNDQHLELKIFSLVVGEDLLHVMPLVHVAVEIQNSTLLQKVIDNNIQLDMDNGKFNNAFEYANKFSGHSHVVNALDKSLHTPLYRALYCYKTLQQSKGEFKDSVENSLHIIRYLIKSHHVDLIRISYVSSAVTSMCHSNTANDNDAILPPPPPRTASDCKETYHVRMNDDVNSQTNNDVSSMLMVPNPSNALHLCVQESLTEVVAELLTYDVIIQHINDIGQNGATCLHIAMMQESDEIMCLLLEAGADYMTVDAKGVLCQEQSNISIGMVNTFMNLIKKIERNKRNEFNLMRAKLQRLENCLEEEKAKRGVMEAAMEYERQERLKLEQAVQQILRGNTPNGGGKIGMFAGHINSSNSPVLNTPDSNKGVSNWQFELSTSLTGHTNTVYCLLSLPGGLLLSGSKDKTIKVWDVSNAHRNMPIKTLTGHAGSVVCLQHMPRMENSNTNGNIVVSSSGDSTIKLWNVATGACITTLRGHGGTVFCVQPLHNGNLASCSGDNTIRIWNTETFETKDILEGHTGSVVWMEPISMSQLASGGKDFTIRIWDVNSGNCIRVLCGHTKPVMFLQMLANGNLVSSSEDWSIKIWKLEDGTCIKTLDEHSRAVYSIQVTPSQFLISGSSDRTIKVWDPRNEWRCIKTVEGHTGAVFCLNLLPDGRIASGSGIDDHSIHVWNVATL